MSRPHASRRTSGGANGHTTRRTVAAAGACTVLAALGLCALASCAASLPQGKGLFWRYPRERLHVDGFPNSQAKDYFSPEWGTLYDERGIAYGPNSLYLGDERLPHPELVVTDSTVQNRWFRVRLNRSATEPAWGHFIELLDLARHDLTPLIGAPLNHLVDVVGARDLDQYRALWGKEYWVTHLVDWRASPALVFEPINVLSPRGLTAHSTRNAVAQLLLQHRTQGKLPAWMLYGLASYLAEEGNLLVNFVNEFRPRRTVVLSPEETMRHLEPLADRENGRIALYSAFLMAWHLSERWGFDRVQTMLAALAGGDDLDAACRKAWKRSYAQVVAMLDPRKLGEPQGSGFGMQPAAPPAAQPQPPAKPPQKDRH
jgi:hypothetical protein